MRERFLCKAHKTTVPNSDNPRLNPSIPYQVTIHTKQMFLKPRSEMLLLRMNNKGSNTLEPVARCRRKLKFNFQFNFRRHRVKSLNLKAALKFKASFKF